MGAFKRQGAGRWDKLGPYDIVLVTCEFENVTLDVRVVFDKAGKIAGFQFVPSLPAAKYEPPAYADLAAFREKEVTVGSGASKLPGTLALPKGEGPFPAFVLVHGSGPNDRNETLGPNKSFRDIAWGLATKGNAVLRYEKQTRVYGPRLVADPKWEKALSNRADVEFRLYPGLNHLFFEGQGLPTPNEYLQVHGSVASDVIADIAALIKRHS